MKRLFLELIRPEVITGFLHNELNGGVESAFPFLDDLLNQKKTAPTAIGADIQVKPTGDGKSLLLFNQNKSNLCILLHAAAPFCVK